MELAALKYQSAFVSFAGLDGDLFLGRLSVRTSRCSLVIDYPHQRPPKGARTWSLSLWSLT
jgi:hypothetical protein